MCKYVFPTPIKETNMLRFSLENQTSRAHWVHLSWGQQVATGDGDPGHLSSAPHSPRLPVTSNLPGFAYWRKLPGPWGHLILEFARLVGLAGHQGPSLSSRVN